MGRRSRAGGAVHVGRWREAERDAATGEVEMDGVVDADVGRPA